MRLLFDQNISFRVVKRLLAVFPGCCHVRDLNLEGKSDREIWAFAKREQYAIVTFDADFHDLAMLYGHPPKIIWVRIGNTSTDHLTAVLRRHSKTVKAFVDDKRFAEVGCLEISAADNRLQAEDFEDNE